MTIKGRLLSSITTVKRFQAEYIADFSKSTWVRGPFPLEFYNYPMSTKS